MFTASGAATGASVGPPPEVPPAPPAPPPSSDTIDLIEYHHAAWDHYFITGIPDEIAKLDNGTFSGWSRTGQKFKAYPVTSQQGAVVCRFFSTAFAPRSSHFYTLLPNECAVVRENADWHYEGDVFRIDVAAFNGACPTTAMPVYRLYNDGQGGAPNHRYTIDASLRAQMIAQGWIPEGFGPDGVMMCAPQ
jgi:hypothetical protein